MQQVSLSLIGLAVVLIVFAHRGFGWYRQYREDSELGRLHGCKPPPRLQNDLPLGVDRLEQIFRANRESRLMELFLYHFRRWGWTLEQRFLGTLAFGTIDPPNLEAMLSTKFKDFGMGPRRNITLPLFGDGIFTQEGSAWKHSRELLRPQFSYKQYESLEIFRDHVDNLIANLPVQGGNVDLQPLFFRLTLDTTTAFLFGESVESLKAPTNVGEQSFAGAFNKAQEYVAKRFRLLDVYWLIGGREFQECCNRVHQFADAILHRSLDNISRQSEDEKTKYLFLDRLAKDSHDRTALREQIINVLIAGRDTTASLLCWTFWLLVRHPQVLEKLRKDINTVCDNVSELRRTDLRKMEYLQNVLKETLRLYPPLPVNQRAAVKTTILPMGGGHDRTAPVLVRKGTAIAYSVYSLHRRPDLFGEDAEDFRPERWTEDLPLYKDETSAAWGFLPFNGGPRVCLGMDFAYTEAAYTVVRVLQHFSSISKPADESFDKLGTEKQTMTLVITPTEGCKVNVTE